MNKEAAMRWADALESGKYKQTIGMLKDERGYCCLGVLCEVDGIKKEDIVSGDKQRIYTLYGKDRDRCFLPTELVYKYDMSSRRAHVYTSIKHRGKTYDNLAEMNDAGVRFKTIARYIRKYWEKL